MNTENEQTEYLRDEQIQPADELTETEGADVPKAPHEPDNPEKQISIALDQREADLAAREEAFALREREFQARENLLALGLPEEILTHMDFGSDHSVASALRIAALASRSQPTVPAVPVPRQATPPAPAFASYLERACLFLEDPDHYKHMTKNKQ